MAENTGIEWCDHTFNPWRGCTKVSPGCTNCYAETLSGRNPKVLGVWGPNGTRPVAAEGYWRLPLAWDRKAAREGVRRRVFCASLADVFEEVAGASFGAVEEARKRLFGDSWRNEPGLIEQTPNLDWLLLTKRPENIGRILNRLGLPGWWNWIANSSRNVWLGVSVEDQRRADERIPLLLRVPAAVRFLSAEPLLGAIEFSNVGGRSDAVQQLGKKALDGIHWVIVGGESGPNARPMHPDWARSLRDQCRAAGVPFFFKQWGGWVEAGRPTDADEVVQMAARSDRWVNPQGGAVHTTWDTVAMNRAGKKAAGRELDGRQWSEFPETARA